MAPLDALQIRDYIALTLLQAMAPTSITPTMAYDDLVRRAFAMADAFIEQSTSKWAAKARAEAANHPESPEQK